MNADIFNALSDFYLGIWRYLGAFFDDTRWIEAAPPSSTPENAFNDLRKSYLALVKRLDDVLRTQIESDFNKVKDLHSNHDSYNATWRNQAQELRLQAQELGLKYAALALAIAE
jgi:hypothetical protein